MKAINPGVPAQGVESLHYVGYDDDRGGIVSVVRALDSAHRFGCLLGVNPGFLQRRSPALPTLELPPLEGERLGLETIWRARGVAREVIRWLEAGSARVFHGHSRAGLAVALWLDLMGERRAVVSVHCYGRRRGFYRWASRRLGDRLFWLSPAMKRYYGVGDETWDQCIPGCIPDGPGVRPERVLGSGGTVLFGGMGALVPWKNWHLILGAVAALPQSTRQKLRFIHIGSATADPASKRFAAELRLRTAELGLEAVVEWRGELPSPGGFLAEIDCLVVASSNEPFSVSVLEALAAGVPVLAADSGGARDVVAPGRNGWLFRSGDESDLALHLGRLANEVRGLDVSPSPGDLDRFFATAVAARWAKVYSDALGS